MKAGGEVASAVCPQLGMRSWPVCCHVRPKKRNRIWKFRVPNAISFWVVVEMRAWRVRSASRLDVPTKKTAVLPSGTVAAYFFFFRPNEKPNERRSL